MDSEIFVFGIFKYELKNRFLCLVIVNDKPEICYVPSSCHLANFIDLKDKEVLLVRNTNPKSRTDYRLFAIPIKRNYLLLNSSIANSTIFDNLSSRQFFYLGKRKDVIREHSIKKYKADLFIQDTKTIVEIKSIISTKSSAIFPTVYSERSLQQSKEINQLLHEGYHAYLFLVALSPYVNNIVIDTESEFYNELKECVSSGLNIRAMSLKLIKGKPMVYKSIHVVYKSNYEKCEKCNFDFLVSKGDENG